MRAQVVPKQLPAAVRHFTGRTAALGTLDGLLATASGEGVVPICAISGTAGVGKSSLAVHWAHRAAEQFPGGQLFVNLRGFGPDGFTTSTAEAVRGFLDAFEIPPQRIPVSLDAQVALYRTLLAGRPVLVVLDNARDSEQVRTLLPGSPGCLVVVTSRNQLSGLIAGQSAHALTLDVLNGAEARQLLAQRLGTTRIEAEPDAVDDIIARCAGLPLALAIIAARVAAHPSYPLEALAAQLRETYAARLNLLKGDDAASDLQAVFSWSYAVLRPETAKLFRQLGLHTGPDITAAAAASIGGVSLSQAQQYLIELTAAHLLTEHAPGRYSFHDLLRAYANDLTLTQDSDTDRQAAGHRVLDHYLHTAHRAAMLLEPHPYTRIFPPTPQAGVVIESPTSPKQAMTWFNAEYPNLLAAVNTPPIGRPEFYAWQIVWTLSTFLDRRGHWHERVVAARAALEAAQQTNDHIGRATAHLLLGNAYGRWGRLDDSSTQFLQALDGFETLGEASSQAAAHIGLSGIAERQGRNREALQHARQAYDLFLEAGDRTGQANALNNMGWCHAVLGEAQQALSCCEVALPMLQDIGDRDGEAATWDSIGYAQHHLGLYDEAIVSYDRSIRLYRDLNDRYNEADTLTHMAEVYAAAGGAESARPVLQRALEILTELDHPDAETIRAKLR